MARTTYYPYGGTRTTSGAQQTDRLFTDQRAEGAALGALYDYGARHYDTYLNRFISADTIVPGAGNPQALNRYAYVNNNPLKYTDPSGHISEGEANTASDIIDELYREYGVFIEKDFGWVDQLLDTGEHLAYWKEGNWKELKELEWVRQAVYDFADKVGGKEGFRDKVGRVTFARGVGYRGDDKTYLGRAKDRPAFTANGVATFWDETFTDEAYGKRTVVHESAHLWDKVGVFHAHGGPLSLAMEARLGGTSVDCGLLGECRRQDFPVPNTSRSEDWKYANSHRREDWAVAVTNYVYNMPLTVERAQFVVQQTGR